MSGKRNLHEGNILYFSLKVYKKTGTKKVRQCIPLLSWKVRKGVKTIGSCFRFTKWKNVVAYKSIRLRFAVNNREDFHCNQHLVYLSCDLSLRSLSHRSRINNWTIDCKETIILKSNLWWNNPLCFCLKFGRILLWVRSTTNMCKRRHLGSFVGKKCTEFAYVKSVIWNLNTDERFQEFCCLFVVSPVKLRQVLGVSVPFDFACYTVLVLCYRLRDFSWNGRVMRYWKGFYMRLRTKAKQSKHVVVCD